MTRTPRSFHKRHTNPTSQGPSQRWMVGAILAKAREERELSLREVSTLTQDLDPDGRGIAYSQIHRIEKDAAVADLRELDLLCRVLRLDLTRVLEKEPSPWFLVREATARNVLKEVHSGLRRFHRIRGNHEYMIESLGSYKYVPLQEEFVADEEREGSLDPVMRKFFFEVHHCSMAEIRRGFDSHAGEEIVFVLDGELEFFIKQGGSSETKKLLLVAGDCLQYSSRLHHAYRSPQQGTTASALFVYVEPKSPTGPQFVTEKARESKR